MTLRESQAGTRGAVRPQTEDPKLGTGAWRDTGGGGHTRAAGQVPGRPGLHLPHLPRSLGFGGGSATPPVASLSSRSPMTPRLSPSAPSSPSTLSPPGAGAHPSPGPSGPAHYPPQYTEPRGSHAHLRPGSPGCPQPASCPLCLGTDGLVLRLQPPDPELPEGSPRAEESRAPGKLRVPISVADPVAPPDAAKHGPALPAGASSVTLTPICDPGCIRGRAPHLESGGTAPWALPHWPDSRSREKPPCHVLNSRLPPTPGTYTQPHPRASLKDSQPSADYLGWKGLCCPSAAGNPKEGPPKPPQPVRSHAPPPASLLAPEPAPTALCILVVQHILSACLDGGSLTPRHHAPSRILRAFRPCWQPRGAQVHTPSNPRPPTPHQHPT
ncbi:uncharacterized protein [Bos indicus]|uniref:Basic proline-rich protein-like n=1 Tax=Bos indicus TaxID=9915 RepID=A0ABM4SGC5_BOSIN